MRAGPRELPAPGRLAVGTELGKYEIVRFIAEGGMGELYVARAKGIEGFEKTVALKRILSRFAAREDHVRMFLDEAKLAATLHHPNIVQVFDIGDEAGVLFFSMEYVHGTDVRALLEAARASARPVPLDAALEIVLGVAGGLHHAHQAGIVHRDVSPSNVLLAHDGGVKVTDFGVAKVERTVETRPGMMKGKVSYMSPEQCRDESLDRRSDVFAIGILLYELTTLDKPFPGTSDFAIMEQIVHRDPEPPSTKRTTYPPELEAIVLRALQRDREARYATAQDLQRELRRLARDSKLDTSPLALESYLRALFGDRVDAWRQAEVESSLRGVLPTAATVREKPAERALPQAPSRARRTWPIVAGIAAVVALTAVSAGLWLRDDAADAPAATLPRDMASVPGPSDPSSDEGSSTSGPSDPSSDEGSSAASRLAPSPVERAVRVREPKRTPRTEPANAPPPAIASPPVMSPPPADAAAPPPVAPASTPDASPAREVPWDPDSPTLPKKNP